MLEPHVGPPEAPDTIPRVHRAWRAVKAFFVKAFRENITGLSGMVAYNLLLSLFPLALLALFIASRVLRSPELQESVFRDLQRLFPTTAKGTITHVLERVKSSSAGIGIFALITSIWFGSSFWGALDTAFCRIYHVTCRGWVQQKRFALGMLVVVLLFMAATVVLPSAQSILAKGTSGLPLGLNHVDAVVYLITIGATLLLLFGILCIVYWTVPNRLVPWRAIWPGALAATLAIGVVDYGFPLYLSGVSTFARLGTTLVFIVIVLLWFYALALIILGGAIINAMRFELHDTGTIDLE